MPQHDSTTEQIAAEADRIYDGMTVADAIAVLQQFDSKAPLILQCVLPSGEVHSLPLRVFQPHPDFAVGMVMRCQPTAKSGEDNDDG